MRPRCKRWPAGGSRIVERVLVGLLCWGSQGCVRDECRIGPHRCEGDVLITCEPDDLAHAGWGSGNIRVEEDCTTEGDVCFEDLGGFSAACFPRDCEAEDVGQSWCHTDAVAHCEARDDAFRIRYEDCAAANQRCVVMDSRAVCRDEGDVLRHTPTGGDFEILWDLPSLPVTGTDTAFSGFYASTVHQYLYLGEELSAAGLQPGARVASFWLHCAGLPGSLTLVGMRLAVLQTEATALDRLVTSPAPEVSFGPRDVARESFEFGDWTEFPLDTPLRWDGSSNLLLEVSLEDPFEGKGGSGGLYHHPTGDRVRHEGGATHSALPYPFIGINNHIHDGDVAALGVSLVVE